VVDKNHRRGSNYCAFAPPRVITQMLILLALNSCTGCVARSNRSREIKTKVVGREREKESTIKRNFWSLAQCAGRHTCRHSGSTGIIKIQHGDSVSQSHHISTSTCCAIFYSIVRKVASAVSQPSSRIRTKCGREEGFTLPLGAASRKRRKGYPCGAA
jgi:hypothetical protein